MRRIDKIEKLSTDYRNRVQRLEKVAVPILGIPVAWGTVALVGIIASSLAGMVREKVGQGLMKLSGSLTTLVEYTQKELPSGKDWGKYEQYKSEFYGGGPKNPDAPDLPAGFLPQAAAIQQSLDLVANIPSNPDASYIKNVETFDLLLDEFSASLPRVQSVLEEMQHWFAKYFGGAAETVMGFIGGSPFDLTDLSSVQRAVPQVQNSVEHVRSQIKPVLANAKKLMVQKMQESQAVAQAPAAAPAAGEDAPGVKELSALSL